MPAVSPRVQVTLSIELDNLVARLARCEDVSKSQVLRELLEAAAPALHRVVALMEAADGAGREMRKGLAKVMLDRQVGIEASLDAVMDAELEMHLTREHEAYSAERAGVGSPPKAPNAPAARVRRGTTPVPVTRGSGLKNRGAKGGRS